MTEKAIRLILARFTRQYGERFLKTVNGQPAADPAQVLADWTEDLADLDDDTGYTAAAEVRRALPHPPTPADVIREAKALGWAGPDKWERARRMLADQRIPIADRRRRVRQLLFGEWGSRVHFGWPDDPPFPWQILGNDLTPVDPRLNPPASVEREAVTI